MVTEGESHTREVIWRVAFVLKQVWKVSNKDGTTKEKAAAGLLHSELAILRMSNNRQVSSSTLCGLCLDRVFT